ncbi:hypothetical protein F5Y17DRAFT_372022 [Xylariaceae sp. FL0594]|nr:hypothetical protein F5Y17DRAFT_372022 [Xylariaceae sp. FL0594]
MSDATTLACAQLGRKTRVPVQTPASRIAETSSAQANKVTSGPETPVIEYPVASFQPTEPPNNPAFSKPDMTPFVSQELLVAQSISATPMSPYAETWPLLSWAEAAAATAPRRCYDEIPWHASVLYSTAIAPPLQENWDTAIPKYCFEERPLTPISGQTDMIFSDVQLQTSSLLSESPVVAAYVCDDGRAHTSSSSSSEHSSVSVDYLHNWSHHPQVSQTSYQCFQKVIFIFEELERGRLGRSITELGPWLSVHKEAIRCAEALLLCDWCQQRKQEYVVVFHSLTDRLVSMCKDVVSKFLDVLQQDGSNTMIPKDNSWVVLMGSFEVDTAREWGALVRTMLILQLRDLDVLMIRFGGRSGSWSWRADLTHRKIMNLLQKLTIDAERREVASPSP